MVKEIPPLKARAQSIHWALKCIRDNAGNYQKIETCILSQWRAISLRSKPPSEKKSVRAVFGPTLRHLQLVMGQGDRLELMSKGEELLSTYEKEGETVYKKALARHLLKLERDQWASLISELEKLRSPTSIDTLMDYLKRQGYLVTRDRLKKLLSYYEYVDLVKLDGTEIKLRKTQLEVLQKGIDMVPSKEKFIKILFRAYENVKRASNDPYVPIPIIREVICDETGIWPDDFYKLLAGIQKETDSYLIHLTQPMTRKAGGIRLGGKYLYYIAIYKK